MKIRIFVVLAAWVAAWAFSPPAAAQDIGIVVMHGKGGSPKAKHIVPFVSALEGGGLAVANLNMPWSGSRNYDVPVERGEEEVRNAVAALRAQGAKKVFVAGHSQGGAFNTYLAGSDVADGYIMIAPGGDVSGGLFRANLGEHYDRARKLVAEGKGAEPVQLADFEGAKGTYPVMAVPAAYVTWFDPEGAMATYRVVRAIKPGTPVLWIVPTRDYPGLLKTSIPMFGQIASSPHTRLYQPSADHLGAPVASADEIVKWTREVAGLAKP